MYVVFYQFDSDKQTTQAKIAIVETRRSVYQYNRGGRFVLATSGDLPVLTAAAIKEHGEQLWGKPVPMLGIQLAKASLQAIFNNPTVWMRDAYDRLDQFAKERSITIKEATAEMLALAMMQDEEDVWEVGNEPRLQIDYELTDDDFDFTVITTQDERQDRWETKRQMELAERVASGIATPDEILDFESWRGYWQNDYD